MAGGAQRGPSGGEGRRRGPRNMVHRAALLLIVMSTLVPQTQAQFDSFLAAVVEYSPELGVNAENMGQRFRENVDAYIEFTHKAKQEGASIVVFPECGLATLQLPRLPPNSYPLLALKMPAVGENPCKDQSRKHAKEVRDLSCAARNATIYTVVNMPEEEECDPVSPIHTYGVTTEPTECPPIGRRYFNTDLAFGPDGTVLARYRKFNLFGEAGFTAPLTADLVSFETNFGETFGIITCFDIMFKTPAIDLVREKGIRNIIFPTAWFSELPFLTAAQTQAAWAHALDVNVLAAGYNAPAVGSTGSGLYAGANGAVVTIMQKDKRSRMLIGELPLRARHRDASKVTDLDGRSLILPMRGEHITSNYGVMIPAPNKALDHPPYFEVPPLEIDEEFPTSLFQCYVRPLDEEMKSMAAEAAEAAKARAAAAREAGEPEEEDEPSTWTHEVPMPEKIPSGQVFPPRLRTLRKFTASDSRRSPFEPETIVWRRYTSTLHKQGRGSSLAEDAPFKGNPKVLQCVCERKHKKDVTAASPSENTLECSCTAKVETKSLRRKADRASFDHIKGGEETSKRAFPGETAQVGALKRKQAETSKGKIPLTPLIVNESVITIRLGKSKKVSFKLPLVSDIWIVHSVDKDKDVKENNETSDVHHTEKVTVSVEMVIQGDPSPLKVEQPFEEVPMHEPEETFDGSQGDTSYQTMWQYIDGVEAEKPVEEEESDTLPLETGQPFEEVTVEESEKTLEGGQGDILPLSTGQPAREVSMEEIQRTLEGAQHDSITPAIGQTLNEVPEEEPEKRLEGKQEYTLNQAIGPPPKEVSVELLQKPTEYTQVPPAIGQPVEEVPVKAPQSPIEYAQGDTIPSAIEQSFKEGPVEGTQSPIEYAQGDTLPPAIGQPIEEVLGEAPQSPIEYAQGDTIPSAIEQSFKEGPVKAPQSPIEYAQGDTIPSAIEQYFKEGPVEGTQSPIEYAQDDTLPPAIGQPIEEVLGEAPQSPIEYAQGDTIPSAIQRPFEEVPVEGTQLPIEYAQGDTLPPAKEQPFEEVSVEEHEKTLDGVKEDTLHLAKWPSAEEVPVNEPEKELEGVQRDLTPLAIWEKIVEGESVKKVQGSESETLPPEIGQHLEVTVDETDKALKGAQDDTLHLAIQAPLEEVTVEESEKSLAGAQEDTLRLAIPPPPEGITVEIPQETVEYAEGDALPPAIEQPFEEVPVGVFEETLEGGQSDTLHPAEEQLLEDITLKVPQKAVEYAQSDTLHTATGQPSEEVTVEALQSPIEYAHDDTIYSAKEQLLEEITVEVSQKPIEYTQSDSLHTTKEKPLEEVTVDVPQKPIEYPQSDTLYLAEEQSLGEATVEVSQKPIEYTQSDTIDTATGQPSKEATVEVPQKPIEHAQSDCLHTTKEKPLEEVTVEVPQKPIEYPQSDTLNLTEEQSLDEATVEVSQKPIEYTQSDTIDTATGQPSKEATVEVLQKSIENAQSDTLSLSKEKALEEFTVKVPEKPIEYAQSNTLYPATGQRTEDVTVEVPQKPIEFAQGDTLPPEIEQSHEEESLEVPENTLKGTEGDSVPLVIGEHFEEVTVEGSGGTLDAEQRDTLLPARGQSFEEVPVEESESTFEGTQGDRLQLGKEQSFQEVRVEEPKQRDTVPPPIEQQFNVVPVEEPEETSEGLQDDTLLLGIGKQGTEETGNAFEPSAPSVLEQSFKEVRPDNTEGTLKGAQRDALHPAIDQSFDEVWDNSEKPLDGAQDDTLPLSAGQSFEEDPVEEPKKPFEKVREGKPAAVEEGRLYLKTEDLSNYASVLIGLDDGCEKSTLHVCHEGFCCEFHITMIISNPTVPVVVETEAGETREQATEEKVDIKKKKKRKHKISSKDTGDFLVDRAEMATARQFTDKLMQVIHQQAQPTIGVTDFDVDDMSAYEPDPGHAHLDKSGEFQSRADSGQVFTAEFVIGDVQTRADTILEKMFAEEDDFDMELYSAGDVFDGMEDVADEDMMPSDWHREEMDSDYEDDDDEEFEEEEDYEENDEEEDVDESDEGEDNEDPSQKPKVLPNVPPPLYKVETEAHEILPEGVNLEEVVSEEPPKHAEEAPKYGEKQLVEDEEDSCVQCQEEKEKMTPTRYQYRIVVYEGIRSFDGLAEGGLQVCAIISCTDAESIDSCGKMLDEDVDINYVRFESVSIKGYFKKAHALPLPSTLDGNLLPLPAMSFEFQTEPVSEEEHIVHMSTQNASFLTFGIYSREFSADSNLFVSIPPLR